MKETLHTRKVPKKCEGPNFGVGSIGKVKVLMMQELDSESLKRKPSNTVPVSVYCFESRKRTEMVKTKSDHKINTTATNNIANATNNRRSTGSARKRVCQIPSPHCIPMLELEDIAMEKTSIRVGTERRSRTQFVNVVDLKCGNGYGKGLSSPIANQIRRLRFSKLSG